MGETCKPQQMTKLHAEHRGKTTTRQAKLGHRWKPAKRLRVIRPSRLLRSNLAQFAIKLMDLAFGNT